MWWLETTAQPVWQILTRVGIDLFIIIVSGGISAVFWVETTDMGLEATAKQTHNSGIQIPGFRQNVCFIEKVFERYPASDCHRWCLGGPARSDG
jgi:preprotein translocase subunit SecY